MDHLFIKELLKYLQTSKVNRFIKEDTWACTHGNNLMKKENTTLLLWKWNKINNHNCFRLSRKLRSSKLAQILISEKEIEKERKGKERKEEKKRKEMACETGWNGITGSKGRGNILKMWWLPLCGGHRKRKCNNRVESNKRDSR